MRTKIDFRKNGNQTVNLPFAGISKITYLGKCPVTGVRLYESDTGNDPRGPLGIHAATEFVAEEYGMEGPTLNASWIACNNDRNIYEKALVIAKKSWKEKE
jgi:hypothetical protein